MIYISLSLERMMNIDTFTKRICITGYQAPNYFYRLWHTSSDSYIAPYNFHRHWHKTCKKECVNVCLCPYLWVSLSYPECRMSMICSSVFHDSINFFLSILIKVLLVCLCDPPSQNSSCASGSDFFDNLFWWQFLSIHIL